jgi:hypothetical protein
VGTKALLRRKNVLTLDLCDPALKAALVQFFELYNGMAVAGCVPRACVPRGMD